MLKVVVFDSGWGGDLVADYIEKEIAVLEVIRVIDWRGGPFVRQTRQEMCQRAERALRPYLGHVDVIILASYVGQEVLVYLQSLCPQQKFVKMEWPRQELEKETYRKILVLSAQRVFQTPEYRQWEHSLVGREVLKMDCGHWTELIDEGTLTQAQIRRELAQYRDRQIDTVVLGNTHLWDLQGEIGQVLSWQPQVLDQKLAIQRKLYLALELEGASYIMV